MQKLLGVFSQDKNDLKKLSPKELLFREALVQKKRLKKQTLSALGDPPLNG